MLRTFASRLQRLAWAARGGLLILFFAAGLLTAKAVNLESPFPCSTPTQLVWTPDVASPALYGLLSGLLLGQYPTQAFGQPQACLDVDAGRGLSAAQWPLMVRAAAKTWAVSRAVGFALDSLLLWWVLSWVWRAARVLLCSDSKTPKVTA